MNQAYKIALAGGLLMMGLTTCRIKITPLTPPTDPVKTKSICEVPPIEQNIIGTWHCGVKRSVIGDTVPKSAQIRLGTFERVGTLIFSANKVVSDPDSSLPNHVGLDGYKLSHFGYTLKTDTAVNGTYTKMGKLFWIHQYYRNEKGKLSLGEGYYHKVLSNECNRIHLKGDALEIVLVK
jgi:hypothetical protein